MDPTNNPMPTPSPEPNAEPVSNAVPEATPAPEPAPQAGTPVGPAEPGVAPVNPIINPGGNAVNPVVHPSGQGLAATDPIMRPEPAPAPDPIEEELKAPMKAAEPVPGSIGSAVSGPAGAPTEVPAENPFATSEPGAVPSVSFNDPAAQPQSGVDMGANAKPAKDKNNKTTLIILIAVAAVIVIALVVVLILQLTSGGSGSSSDTTINDETAIDEGEENEEETEVEELTDGTMSCTSDMSETELAKFAGATSGVVKVDAEFAGGVLSKITLTNLIAAAENGAETAPVEVEATTETEEVTDGTDGLMAEAEKKEITAAELTNDNTIEYYLDMRVDGDDLPYNAVRENYEDLDFVCEVL